ncbi:MAG: magnesium transporter [Planctomycetaceae bacterium]|jgi:magnesium transporter
MKPAYHKRHPPAGSRPGTLMIPADSPPPVIHLMEFTPETLEERDITDVESLNSVHDSEHCFWIDVQGLGSESTLRRIAEIFSLHLLTLEDIANAPSRPKTETHDDYQQFVTRMVRVSDDGVDLIVEQVCIIWGRNFVLTIQEKAGDILDPIRSRMRTGKGRPIRSTGPDYVAYAIIDCIIDGFFPVLDQYAEWLSSLEEACISDPTPSTLEEINQVRRELMMLGRAVWPQCDAIHRLASEDSPFVGDNVRVFLRDTHNHTVQVADVVDSFRELATGLLSTYLSTTGNRTNDIMKVLTIMASIFIPLTFMAGIYGMNFESMPELKLPWAYPLLWGVMLTTAGGMIFYFRQIGWIGRPKKSLKDKSQAGN